MLINNENSRKNLLLSKILQNENIFAELMKIVSRKC